MKTLLFVLLSLITFNLGYSQIAYYDAIELAKHLNPGTNDLKLSSEVFEILDFYLDPSKENTKKELFDAFDHISNPQRDPNPFISFSGTIQSADDDANTTFENKIESIASSVSSFNITTIADGAAQFLVERAKEEIMLAYFSGFKKVFEEQKEIELLFPTTSTYILTLDPYQYATLLHALRDAFIEDLSKLPNNISSLSTLEKEPYQSFFKENEGLLFLLALDVAQSVDDGDNFAEVLYHLGSSGNPYLSKMTGKYQTLHEYLKLSRVLSESVRSKDNASVWVPFGKLEDLIKNPTTFKLYLGLVHHKLDTIQVGNNTVQVNLGKFSADIKQIESGFLQLSAAFNRLDRARTKIENFTIQNKTPDIASVKTFTSSIIHLLNELNSFGIIINRNDITKLNEDYDKFIKVIDQGFSIYENLQAKKYTAAVIDASILLDRIYLNPKFNGQIVTLKQTLETKYSVTNIDNSIDKQIQSLKNQIKKLEEDGLDITSLNEDLKQLQIYKNINTIEQRLIKYGTFISIIAEADSAEQVKKAIEAIVLPVTSYRIKRISKTSIDINAYLGAFLGPEIDSEKGKPGFGFGSWAPLGISLSGTDRHRFSKGKASNTLFISMFDIGAFASFRLGNTEEALPEFTLQNIIAPGVFYIRGIKESPLAWHLGVQYGPQVRKIEDGLDAASIRFNIGLSVDIPLFNIRATPNN